MLAIRMGFGKGRLMSALGHKRTFAVQKGMSALPMVLRMSMHYHSPLAAHFGAGP